MEKIIYVNDPRSGKPFGVIVVTGPDNIGWSICNDKDQFCKRIGKTIARGRAKKHGYSEPASYYSQLYELYNVLLMRNTMRTVANNLPQRWLEWFPTNGVKDED